MRRQSVGSGLGWVPVLIAAVSLVTSCFRATASYAAPPATLIGRDEADRIALAALAPQNIPSRVAVSGLDGVLKKGTRLGQNGPSNQAEARIVKNKAGLSTVRKMRPVILKSDSWVVWMDLAPGAYFEHPSVLLAVDARTGRIASRLDFWWGPEINLRPATFTRMLYAPPEEAAAPTTASIGPETPTKTYLSRPVRWFADAASPFSSMRLFQSQTDTDTNPLPFAKECIVVLRNPEEKLFVATDKLIEDFADKWLIPKKDAKNAAELQRAVGELTGKDPRCEDVTIWITAHGYRAPASPEELATEKAVRNSGAKAPTSEHPAVELFQEVVFTADDLRFVFSRFPLQKFKLIVESCYAGRWVEYFSGKSATGKLKKPPNLRTIATSSSVSELSYGYAGAVQLPAKQTNGALTGTGGPLRMYLGENNTAKAGWFAFHMVSGAERDGVLLRH